MKSYLNKEHKKETPKKKTLQRRGVIETQCVCDWHGWRLICQEHVFITCDIFSRQI